MKTDSYTKAVLTVIAICLLIIVVKQVDIIPTANASTLTSNLKNNVNYVLVPLNTDGTIDVNLKSSSATVSVNITEVGNIGFGSTVPVKIKE
jgi:hypothetical protein